MKFMYAACFVFVYSFIFQANAQQIQTVTSSAQQEDICRKKRLKFGTEEYSKCLRDGASFVSYDDRAETLPQRICRIKGYEYGGNEFDVCVSNEQEAINQERMKYNAAMLAQKQEVEARLENENATEDDAKCRGYGAKKGSKPYIDCRLQLQKFRIESGIREENDRQARIRNSEASRIQQEEFERSRRSSQLMLGLGLLAGSQAPAPAVRSPVNCTSQWRGGKEYTTCY